MRTITCTLSFRDGQTLRATASAKSPGDIVRYSFEGDVSKLKPFGERGTIGFLEWYLRECATKLDAQIEVSATGEFEPDNPV